MTDHSVARSERSEAELIEALAEDEAYLGRPHTPGEREAFSREFFAVDYREEVRRLTSLGVEDDS